MTAPSRSYDVVGLGVSTLDLLMVIDDFPERESVQRAHSSLLQGGGPVATAMVTVARLGGRAAMVDKVGDDWRGNLILQEFAREGVATEHAVVSAGHSSSIASIQVRKADGARSITYAPGDTEELSAAEVPEDVVASAKILHLNGRHFDACIAAAGLGKRHGVVVSFDGGAHRYRPELKELVALSDVCIVARDFAFSFSGAKSLEASAAALLDAGPGMVVVTAGSEGSWLFEKGDEPFHQPAFEAGRVVDTTGAGDAYHGAFLFGLARGYSLRSCALMASAVAALNTEALGGRSALPTFDEAVAFLAAKGLKL
jgi:sulfofructose kinase